MTRPDGRTVKLADLAGPQEAAEALGVDHETFRKWRQRYPDMPPPVKVLAGGTGLWLRPDLIQWRTEGGGPKPRTSPESDLSPEPRATTKPTRHLRAVRRDEDG